MAFAESAESLGARLRARRVPASAVGGALALAALCIAVLVVSFGMCSSPAFEVEGADEQAIAEGDSDASGEGTSVAGDFGSQESRDEGVVQTFVTVHMAGAVVSPGIYELAQGSRVQDAVDAAGGFSDDAASDAVNLARMLQDGEQVVIPTRQQIEEGIAPQAGMRTSVGTTGASSVSGGLVNINTAGVEELDTLPGVGPATAQAIVTEREEVGPFSSIEDIQRVSGIGEKKYEKLKNAICV